MRAVENALNILIPENARIIRNLIAGIQMVQDHTIHFYHLHGLDWVDLANALKADPQKAAQLAQSISDWPNSTAGYFRQVQGKLKYLAESNQLGLYANAYWGHPAYRLPPEANLMAVAHYLEALEWQKDVIRIHAILGSKNPHVQTHLVGGMALAINLEDENALNAVSLSMMHKLAAKAREFVEKVYIPDLLAIASFYKDWAGYGAGVGNFLAYGDYPEDVLSNTENLYLPRGIILNRDLGKVHPVDHQKITEYVTRSWYAYDDESRGRHPWDGVTEYKYTGPKPPYEFLETDKKYSWVKAPRYDDKPMEVGPLARMLVAYASGHKRVKEVTDFALKELGVGPEALFSVLGRTAARGIETLVLAEMIPVWIEQLETNIKSGDVRIHDGSRWDPGSWPREARGFGFHEAPRGGLGHWVLIEDQKIKRYQCVVPSTWNASPRDAKGQRGPYEQALVGVPVADPERPLEILRAVHSFDPCMACAVHVTRPGGSEVIKVKVT